MNNGIVITDSNAFQEVIDSLEISLKNLIDISKSQEINAERINETDAWSGASAQAMYDKYIMLNKNYPEILYSINLFIKFLKKTLEDYRRLVEEQGKNIDAMASNLDVNS